MKYLAGTVVLISVLKHAEVVMVNSGPNNPEVDYGVLGVIKYDEDDNMHGLLIELAEDINWWAFPNEIEILD